MSALGLEGQVRIAVNNRKILDGVLERTGLDQPSTDPQAMTALRAIDKFDKFGAEGVRLLLTRGRKDESGDFTRARGFRTRRPIRSSPSWPRASRAAAPPARPLPTR